METWAGMASTELVEQIRAWMRSGERRLPEHLNPKGNGARQAQFSEIVFAVVETLENDPKMARS